MTPQQFGRHFFSSAGLLGSAVKLGLFMITMQWTQACAHTAYASQQAAPTAQTPPLLAPSTTEETGSPSALAIEQVMESPGEPAPAVIANASWQLSMWPQDPRPGDVVRLVLKPKSPVREVWVEIWKQRLKMLPSEGHFEVLAGVPIDAATTGNGVKIIINPLHEASAGSLQSLFQCSDVRLATREFESEEIRVARKFTRKALRKGGGKGRKGKIRGLAKGKGKRHIAKASRHAKGPISSDVNAGQEAAYVGNSDHTIAESLPWQTAFIWPKEGGLNTPFGTHRSYNHRLKSRHWGIDIEGKTGEKIVAAQSGIVLFSGKQRASGQMIAIDHGGGVRTYYLHLSKRLLEKGQKVEQGQLVGLVGSTGRVTGPHLHFGTTVNGRFVDPLQILNPDFASQTATPDKLIQLELLQCSSAGSLPIEQDEDLIDPLPEAPEEE